MKPGSASGLQIAFFTFAVALLAVPLSNWLRGLCPLTPENGRLLEKAIPFVAGAIILLAFPALRRQCRDDLGRPVPADSRMEVAIVTLADLLFAFAVAGGIALWLWLQGGELGLARRVGSLKGDEAEMARAFLLPELVRTFVVIVILAPLLEELVFRGMLYRAWERQWGWIPSMLLTSIVFGLYHANMALAFFASIVYVCLLRRTGSLLAPIIAHAASNLVLWYPLLGKHVFPRTLESPGDLSSWSFQLVCLVLAAIAIPVYVWMARRKREPEAFAAARSHGALSQ